MNHPRLVVTVAAVWVLSMTSQALAVPQTKGQQGCINALNKAGAKVAATQGKENAKCVKNAGKGNESDAQACLTADAKLKVSKAKDKTGSTETKKCTEAPDFGRAPVAQINAFAGDQEVALVADVFGADLTAAIIDAGADKTGAGCQAAVIKAYEKLLATKLKTFLKCKKDGLKAETIESEATLEACFDAVAADAKVAKTISKLGSTVTKKCPGVDLDVAFPGECVGALDFAACVDVAVECNFCLMVDAMDGLERDCDLYDNAASDLSCAMLPPTTSTTTTTITTTTTSMTMPPPGPQWGLGCFPTTDCGPSFCPANPLQCTDFIENVGLVAGDEMCFFDCMDGTGFGSFMDVLDCRDGCAGGPIPPPPCAPGPGGGFTGAVTGPSACTASGFAAGVTFGGPSSALKRVLVDFGTTIDEAALFGGTPPPCSGSCPTPSADCDIGAPYGATPSPGLFRVAIGTPSPAAELCDRSGVPTTVCKYDPMGYAFIFDLPPGSVGGIDLTGAPIDVTVFMSCAIESSPPGTFLHFSTGDFLATGTF